MMTRRIVSLTLNIDSTSNNDAVRQFINAVGIYGMGNFDFQVFEDEEDVADALIMINGREAMLATMPDEVARQEEKEDKVRTDVREDIEDTLVVEEGSEEGIEAALATQGDEEE